MNAADLCAHLEQHLATCTVCRVEAKDGKHLQLCAIGAQRVRAAALATMREKYPEPVARVN